MDNHFLDKIQSIHLFDLLKTNYYYNLVNKNLVSLYISNIIEVELIRKLELETETI